MFSPVEHLIQLLHAKRHGKGWIVQCPCHEDRKPSLSISEGSDGRALVRCFAGCATADVLAAVGLTLRDLFPARSRSQSGRPAPTANNNVTAKTVFDWSKKCVAPLTTKDLIRLGNERWYSRSFCAWLHENHYVGMFHDDFAFPVQDNGNIVATHYRVKPAQVGEKDNWYYFPSGVKTRPFVIGDLTKAKQVHIGESPWDMLALADRTDLYQNENHAFIATRGSSNAVLCKDLIRENVSVLAWPQNDKPGQGWLADLCTHVNVPVAKAVTPSLLEDLNAWTKAGASAEDIYAAMFRNELVEKPEIVEPVSETETLLQRLAVLPPLDYEKVREREAEKLNCRVSVLDKLVIERRPPSVSANGELQGRMMDLPDVEIWPEPVAGAEVLDQVADTFSRYIALPDGAADVLALWVGHTQCFRAFQCTPRLNVTSPEKSCGKTTLRDVISTLVPRPLPTENLSVAVLFRVIEKYRPTVLADECDAWIRDNDELRGLLNAGHGRTGRALRCEGESNEVRAFNVFAPAALCGIGALPGTLHDRSIIIRLERAKPGELRARFDSRHVEYETELCRKLARFTADNMAVLEACDPQLPECAFNRLADNWRPLFAVAQIAGGDWPRRGAVAFTKLTEKADIDAQGIGTMLLADIQDILARIDADPVPAADLVDALVEMEDRPWPELSHGKAITKVKLSRMLKRFGIVSATKRDGADTFKGYDRAAFTNAFERYVSNPTRTNS